MFESRFGFSLIKKIGLFFVVLVFVGCATTPSKLKPISSSTPLDPQKGVVVVKLINATDFAHPIETMTLSPKEGATSSEGQYISMSVLDSVLADGANVFASEVPAGDYSFVGFHTNYIAEQIYYQLTLRAGSNFGTFSVEAGGVTDLGVVVFYDSTDGEGKSTKLLRLPASTYDDTLIRNFPFMTSYAGPVNTWHEDGLQDFRSDQYASVVQNPSYFNTEYQDVDGTLFLTAPLGVVLVRSPSGQWSMEAVDTNDRLHSIIALNEETLLFYGAEGAIFSRSKKGEWQNLSLPSADYVSDVYIGENNEINVFGLNADLLKIWRKTEEGAWSIANQFNTARGWLDAPRGEKELAKYVKRYGTTKQIFQDVRYLEDEGVVYIEAASGRARMTRTFRYKANPESWQGMTQIPKKGREREDFIAQAGAVKFRKSRPSAFSMNNLPVSRWFDNANNKWQLIHTRIYRCGEKLVSTPYCSSVHVTSGNKMPAKKQTFRLSGVPWFKNEHEVYAVGNFVDVWQRQLGPPELKYRLLYSNDSGRHWRFAEPELPQKFCGHIVGKIKAKLTLSCKGHTGDIYELDETNKKWLHIREHQHF